MKMLSWVLLAVSAVLFVIGGAAKVFSPAGLLFLPVAWWRASVVVALYAIGLSVLSRDARA